MFDTLFTLHTLVKTTKNRLFTVVYIEIIAKLMVQSEYYSLSGSRFGWSHDNNKIYLKFLLMSGGGWTISILTEPDLHLAINTPFKTMVLWRNAIEELVLDS